MAALGGLEKTAGSGKIFAWLEALPVVLVLDICSLVGV